MKNKVFLWDIVEKINWSYDSDSDYVKCIIVNSLEFSQIKKFGEEIAEVFNELHNDLNLFEIASFFKEDFDFDNDSDCFFIEEVEEVNTFIYNLIADGYEECLRCKENLSLFLKDKEKKYIYNDFMNAIPDCFESEEYKKENLFNSLKKTKDNTLEKLRLLDEYSHLSKSYIKEVKDSSLFFVDIANKVLNKEKIVFDEKEFKEKKEYLDKLSVWARCCFAEEKRNDKNNLNNFIVGHDYENIIKLIIIIEDISSKNIKI